MEKIKVTASELNDIYQVVVDTEEPEQQPEIKEELKKEEYTDKKMSMSEQELEQDRQLQETIEWDIPEEE